MPWFSIACFTLAIIIALWLVLDYFFGKSEDDDGQE